MPGWLKVKLNDAPGANGPELNAPPVAVHVCVTVSLFVTVTVDPIGTDILDGLKANPEMVIAAWAGGTVVVVGGGGGGWVVGGGEEAGGGVVSGCDWVAAPGEATLEGAPADGGAVVAEAPVERPVVGAAPLFGALPGLSVVDVTEPFPVGLVVVVDLPFALAERPDRDVVVVCFPALNDAEVPPQAAVNVTSANPTSTNEARVR